LVTIFFTDEYYLPLTINKISIKLYNLFQVVQVSRSQAEQNRRKREEAKKNEKKTKKRREQAPLELIDRLCAVKTTSICIPNGLNYNSQHTITLENLREKKDLYNSIRHSFDKVSFEKL
jgi:hypothetical protein